ncbi:hypothetical protein F6X40_27520 [Paraburkholderia sp. UCT31]|uniref:hypothetical protein n=1 Tax=Paraburkholderia sp. UCT31 TaxID=2615209 RepID=UPI001655CFB5|nr:hypothetical protein [Paraburkholderia sp. UCT31]MBC8740411.1 hypothetical protein [Paraburkholderia sp. UCT31]
MNWGDLTLRILSGATGALLLYAGLFIYEDEEKAIQNKLENWWLDFTKLHGTVISKQTEISTFAVTKVRDVFDRLFSSNVWSRHAICVAFELFVYVFGLAQVLLLTLGFGNAVLAAAESTSTPALIAYLHLPTSLILLFLLFGACCTYFTYRLYSIFTTVTLHAREYTSRLSLTTIIYYLALISVFYFAGSIVFSPRSPRHTLGVNQPHPVAQSITLILGLVTVVLFILASAYLLRRMATLTIEMESEWPLAIGLTGAWFITILTLYLEVSAAGRFGFHDAISRFLLLAITIGAALLTGTWTFLIAIIAGILTLHRIIWPIMERLLYNLPRHKIIESKRALLTLSSIFLTFAGISGDAWAHILEIAGKFIK